MTTANNDENNDYYEAQFFPNALDLEYPPIARSIMWSHSVQKNRLLEDLKNIQLLDLP